MLTLEENACFFKALSISSALNLLPLQIDLKTGQVQKQSKRLRVFMWKILFSVGICDSFYILGRLLQSILIEPQKYFRWDQFIIHFPSVVGYSAMFYSGFCLFETNLEEYVIVFNQLFQERENPVQKMMDQQLEIAQSINGKQSKEAKGAKSATRAKTTSISVPPQEEELIEKMPKKVGSKVRPLLTWPPQYSLDELLVKILAIALVVTALLIVLVLAIDPSRPQLLYSSLPPEYQNGYSFFGLLAVEAVSVALIVEVACFSIGCQLLFFSKCQMQFTRLDFQLRNLKEKFQGRLFKNRDQRSEIWILRQILKEIKELVLFVELFNHVFPPSIFVFKLTCFLSILFYFFTIRHFQNFPFLAVFSGYIAFIMTLVYGILYQKAFSIPQKTEQLKNEFLFTANKTKSASTSSGANGSFRAEIIREIGGIRDVGVKVGSFHTLERETTPRFIDFVLKNVVNLLVAFPR